MLVEFRPGETPSLFDLVRMERELSTLVGGQKVDLRTPQDLSRISVMKYSHPRLSNMLKADRIRLQHMFDAAKEALDFIRGKSRSDLDADRMLVLSLIKELEIIVGEGGSWFAINETAKEVVGLTIIGAVRIRPRAIPRNRE
jgi:hypothetical protein